MAAQPKNIVVGFDGTDGARRALDAAAQLVGYGSTLTVVTVGARPEPATVALGEAREHLLERLVAATYVLRRGEPAAELVSAASELDADLIVVGRRGGPNGGGASPGSVSADVVQRAACDVLVVG